MHWKFRFFNTAVMSLLLSLLMTLWVTWINLGFVHDFLTRWMQAWGLAFPAAFACVLVLARPVQRFSEKVFALCKEKS